jgi:ABC-2 type transport system ATP-binding protein
MASKQEIETTIEVRNLVKHYQGAKVNAVDDISFAVRRGEIFGLLGPNGAGKTTTIGVLTTGVLPTSGSAYIAGIDVAADPMTVKQHIAIVPQRSNLDQSLRAREILTFHASYHGVPKKEREARAEALLAELSLDSRGKETVRRYSGGMAQRLMLARALMHEPDVLVLDEPTNNLDPQSRLFLWDRIRSLHEQGVTILLTTHDMDEADQLCERIAIMDRGKILVLNTPAELKKVVPGATHLELRTFVPDQASVTIGDPGQHSSTSDPMLERLRALPGIARVETVQVDDASHGTFVYHLYAEDVSALISTVTQTVLQNGAELRDLHLSRPSLEDVFIYLTGRNLR